VPANFSHREAVSLRVHTDEGQEELVVPLPERVTQFHNAAAAFCNADTFGHESIKDSEQLLPSDS
jgi:hypothetical protein